MKKLRYAASRINSARIGANHRLAKASAAVLVGVGSAMTASAQATGVDAQIETIIDGLKASLNTTVGKALAMGAIVLTALIAWRTVKKFTS